MTPDARVASSAAVAPAVLAAACLLGAGVVLAGPGIAAALIGDAKPSPAAEQTVFTAVLFGALLAFGLIGGAVCGRGAFTLGPRPAANAALGASLGLFGVVAAGGLAWIAGAVDVATTRPMLLLWGSALVLLQAGAEEVYFRGWLQRVLAEHWGDAAGVLIAAIAFAGLHVVGGARSPLTLVNLFGGGLLFGLLFRRGGGLAAPIAAHWAWNWGEEMLLGLSPNPGVGSYGALADLELTGAALWGGSAEGLNASVAMTTALLAIVVPLLVLARGRPEAEVRAKAFA